MFIFSILSRLYSSSISNISIGKKQRFDSILDLISPSTQYIADIGTDHCLLPIKIAEKNDNIHKIYAIDSSSLALEGGKKNILIKSNNIQNKIEILEGKGLIPIVTKKVDSIICAGMGSNTAQEICNHNHLDSIKCDRIILQPWPNHIFPILKLYKHLIDSNNWIIDDQRIIQSGHYQHLTTSFIRISYNNINNNNNNNNNSILSWPLTRRLLQNKNTIENKVFIDYLITQNENFFKVKRNKEKSTVPSSSSSSSLSSILSDKDDIITSSEKEILEIIEKYNLHN